MALVGKDQLVHEVAERSELGIAEARRALEEMFGAIETELGKGNEVRLTGFGKFSVSRRKAREGRNPQTGESMQIAARKVPHFSAGAELRNAIPQAPQEGGSEAEDDKTEEISPTTEGATDEPDQASPEEEAAADSAGADDDDVSAEKSAAGKVGSVAASGAKFALVAAAGLAAGVVGGLAVTHRR